MCRLGAFPALVQLKLEGHRVEKVVLSRMSRIFIQIILIILHTLSLYIDSRVCLCASLNVIRGKIGAQHVHLQKSLLIVLVIVIENILPIEIGEERVVDDLLDSVTGTYSIGRVLLKQAADQVAA